MLTTDLFGISDFKIKWNSLMRAYISQSAKNDNRQMSMKHYQRLHWKQQQQRCHHPQIPTIILSPNNNVSSVPLLPLLTYTKQPEEHNMQTTKLFYLLESSEHNEDKGKEAMALLLDLS